MREQYYWRNGQTGSILCNHCWGNDASHTSHHRWEHKEIPRAAPSCSVCRIRVTRYRGRMIYNLVSDHVTGVRSDGKTIIIPGRDWRVVAGFRATEPQHQRQRRLDRVSDPDHWDMEGDTAIYIGT